MKNKHFYRRFFFVLFLLVLVFQAHADESGQRQLKQQIQSISQSLKLKENQKTRLQKKIYASDKKIQRLGDKFLAIKNKQRQSQNRITGLEQEKSSLTSKITASNKTLSQMMRLFYMLPAQTPLNLLISRNNFGKTGRQKVYYDYFIKDYLQQHNKLTTQLVDLNQLDKLLSDQIIELKLLAEKNKKHSLNLELKYQQRSDELAKVIKEIGKRSTKIKLLKNDQKRLEKLAKAIAKLKKKKINGMSFAKQKGGLAWPVNGKVTNKFGRLRSGSKLKWRGVLIETKAGASVKAVSGGRVVFSDWLTGYGFVLIIEHGRGYMSLYGHNQQLLKSVGDNVSKNEQIALAGKSGRNGKPALYFEIRHKGKPINPSKWIVANKSR